MPNVLTVSAFAHFVAITLQNDKTHNVELLGLIADMEETARDMDNPLLAQAARLLAQAEQEL